MKKTLLFVMALIGGMFTSISAQTYSPTLDVNFRTATGNTAWQTVKNAADEGNNDFELTYTAGFFALQKYTVADLQNASKLVLTLTVGVRSGVDAVKLWAFADNTWTAETGIDDILPLVTAQTGIEPRATEGTPNTPLFKLADTTDWWLARKASNGDMYLTQTDPAPTTVISTLRDDADGTTNAVYDLQGRRMVNSQLKSGLYIVGGKKVLVK